MRRPFSTVAGLLLIAVAAAHALRIFYQWPVAVGATAIPIWASYAGAVVSAFLGVMVLRGK